MSAVDYPLVHLVPDFPFRASPDGDALTLCGDLVNPRLVVEDVRHVECGSCLIDAALDPDDDTLADCPTVDDLVKATDGTRDVILRIVARDVSGLRVTPVLERRGDRVVVLSDEEQDHVERAIAAHLDEEVD